MNDASEQMRRWLAAANASRAETSLRWLSGHLGADLFAGSAPLRMEIEKGAEHQQKLFAENPSSCKAIERAAREIQIATSHGYDPRDLRLAQTIASMFTVLRLSWSEAGAPESTLNAVDTAHEGALRQALGLASDQIEAHCRFLLDIRGFLFGLAMGESRFVLIEMPSGNSVPVKLLARLLQDQGKCVEIVRASLSRKSPKAAGITRRELLKKQLQAVQLAKDDILIYLDEWETGSNFRTISEFLKKLVPEGCFLFAAAYMTDKARGHKRYGSFCKHHDDMMSPWGVEAEQYRRLLPPLPSKLVGGYFIWSEHDRTAGYRKMQLHGSMFSSIDESVELLHGDRAALQSSVQILLSELAMENNLPGGPGEGISATIELFEASYEDYLSCRDALEECADEYAKGGELDDFDASMEPILQRYYELLNDRDARLAVCLALTHIHHVGSLDPANRYHFDDQAPVIIKLAGHALNTHRITMDVFNRRLGDMDYGPT